MENHHLYLIGKSTVTGPFSMANLVGGFNHLEKYEFVNGKDYPIYEMENNIHV
jgi:hypothetical protein